MTPPHFREKPKLLVVVDTEEEFDWGKPHSRSEISVTHMKFQERTQRIFERYKVKPTYVVDFPIASQEQGSRPIAEWLSDGLCGIGAHLHPWVNPPFEEELSLRNSYPGNLPRTLEKEKLLHLTRAIESRFGERPVVYRAGRYGIGPATGEILEELGYEVDSSIVPSTDFSADGGPDFSAFSVDPFWFGPSGKLLEIPLTVGWCGRLKAHSKALQRSLMSDTALRLHAPGVFARLRLLERIRLTPEGMSFAELKRLTDTMLELGKHLFVFCYHSPSVAPGHTPYVRDQNDLQRFLALIERYCDYFFGVCQGEATTVSDVRAAMPAGVMNSDANAFGEAAGFFQSSAQR